MQKDARARTGSQSLSCLMFLNEVWKQMGHQLKSEQFQKAVPQLRPTVSEAFPEQELGIQVLFFVF